MSNVSKFGVNWKYVNNLFSGKDNIAEYSNDEYGHFYISKLLSDYPRDECYKIVALIHEKSIFEEPYFIVENSNVDFWKDKLSKDYYGHSFTVSSYDDLLADFPINIIEMQERVLMLLHKKYPKYGYKIEKVKDFHFFCERSDDFLFVIESMKRKEWIKIEIIKNGDLSYVKTLLEIAENGWLEIEKNIKHIYSKQGFIAMWFDPAMDLVKNKIKEAINDTKIYLSQRIDEKQFNNEITGEILFEISNSKFVVADLTGQRNGVYFEAGFAIGKNIPVIFTCKKEEEKSVHFDVRQYNIILWNDEEDLYVKLKDRILGTIIV